MAIAQRTPVASRSATSVRLMRHGSSPRRARRTRRRTPNEMTSRTRPIVQSAWFQASPLTVLPMSSVIWLVSVVIGCGQRRGHDRPVADDHLDGERLAGRPHHAQDHGGQEARRGGREQDVADRLPARGAEGERADRRSRGMAMNDVVGDARDRRQDHQRQDERAGEPAEADGEAEPSGSSRAGTGRGSSARASRRRRSGSRRRPPSPAG